MRQALLSQEFVELTGLTAFSPTLGSRRALPSKSFFPISLSLKLWGRTLANRCIVFMTDNEALVSIINKQTTPHKDIMVLVRALVVSSLQYNIVFTAEHIPGRHNVIADHLSRCQVRNAKALAPWLDKLPQQLDPAWLPW